MSLPGGILNFINLFLEVLFGISIAIEYMVAKQQSPTFVHLIGKSYTFLIF